MKLVTDEVVVSLLSTSSWRPLPDLIVAIRMRKRIGYLGIMVALRRLVDRGKIERRGARGSYEYRLLGS